MLDGGGGFSYSGTNWSLYDVPTMWAALQNQQTDNHWQQVTGWRKAYELTSTHLWRLKKYRDKLAEAWPPEKSAASAAYVARLDYLIGHVQQVYDVAITNYSTFASATDAISTSRFELKKIYDEYVSKKQALSDYNDRVEFEKASQLPGVALGNPPATQADLDQLTYRAQAIMYELSGTVIEAQAQIKQPPPYQPQMVIDDPGTSPSGGAGTGPPAIPPIVPLPAATSAAANSQASRPSNQVAPVTSTTGVGPVLGSAGLMLMTPSPVTPPGPSVNSPSPTPAPAPGTGVIGISPTFPTSSGIRPGPKLIGRSSPVGTPMGPITGSPKAGVNGVAGGVPRAMPPGGVIGGPPGAGFGQPAAGAQAARRANPIGGVIGGQRAGAGGGMSPIHPSTGQPFGAHTGGRASQRHADHPHGRRWDPDNPWETNEGITPVVLPPGEPGRIDPGPAIGFHR